MATTYNKGRRRSNYQMPEQGASDEKKPNVGLIWDVEIGMSGAYTSHTKTLAR